MSDLIQRLFGGMRIAATALKAERTRLDTIAKNIANAQVTRMPDTGEAYRREVVHFKPLLERLENGKKAVTERRFFPGYEIADSTVAK